MTTTTKSDRFISDIDYEHTSQGIVLMYWHGTNKTMIKSKPIFIDHVDLNAWLKDEGYLEWDVHLMEGGKLKEDEGEVGYIDYIREVETQKFYKVLHEYMVAKGITNLKYRPD